MSGRPLAATLVAVLVKDFADAKTRLRLSSDVRTVVAAQLALKAMLAVPSGSVVIAGSADVARVAEEIGLEAVLEDVPHGQNAAAARAVEVARQRGCRGLLLLAADLPLVNSSAVTAMLERAASLKPPCAVAAPAAGRGGTNALYLAPPDALDLHFGDQSLRAFETEARTRDVRFEHFEAPELALDLDVPADLEELRARR
jgi:2-phospho-L-lactate guanylyltransferase